MFHTKACILYILYPYLIIMITASFQLCLQWNKKKTKMNLSNNFPYSPVTHINEGTGKYKL